MVYKMENNIYDIIIIGGGPAGYTAALYAARAGLSALLIERLAAGGQMALTHMIDNYPGFPEGVPGFELATKMQAQAERFGSKTVFSEVLSAKLSESPKKITTADGDFFGKTVVIATGANPRELGLQNEKELIGRGLGYCAACDGMFYRGKDVAVIGGGDTAASDALLLSRIAKSVTLIHRRDTLRATKIYHEPLFAAENVKFMWSCVPTELLFGDKVTGVRVKNVKTDEVTEISCEGIFVSIGRKPATELFGDDLLLDDGGYIIAAEDTKTNIPGVFAAGDVRTKKLRQVVTATSDGAASVHMAEEFITESKIQHINHV